MTQLEAELQVEYGVILNQEELVWFQRARGNNVRFGDRNTKYFHMHAVIINRRNRIHRLKLQDGTWCTDQGTLAQKVQSHFQALFALDTSREDVGFSHERYPSLTEVEGVALASTVSSEEVRKALMSMKSFTSRSPDGFQPCFYKRFWDLIGGDVCSVVQNAFIQGRVEAKLLESLVVLIPKVESPSSVKELRPISLCNVLYKVITKVLVNRLRPMMNRLIGPMQSSFLPGRGTMDNAFLDQEIIHHMNSSLARKGLLAFKFDLEKAYDSVS